MKLLVVCILIMILVLPLQAQELSIFGELQDSTLIFIDSLSSFEVQDGVLYTKSGSKNNIFSAYNALSLKQLFKEQNKTLVNKNNFGFYISSEHTGWDNINSNIYDSVQNLIYVDSNKQYHYSLTPNGKFLFTSFSLEENYMYVYDIINHRKIRLEEVKINTFWKAVAPNDSLILLCNDFDLFHLDLITGDVFNTLTKRYSNKKIHELNLFPPYWYTSDDGMNILLNWSDTLYLFDTNGDILWRKGKFTITHHIAISSKINIAFILLSNHKQITCQLIDLESANILDTITIPSETLPQFWKTQSIDNYFILQPNSITNNRLSNFSDTCKTYIYKYNLDKKVVTLQEILKGNVFFAKVENGIRSFRNNPNNPNEIIIKDWKQ